jgi:hypothetical protein
LAVSEIAAGQKKEDPHSGPLHIHSTQSRALSLIKVSVKLGEVQPDPIIRADPIIRERSQVRK